MGNKNILVSVIVAVYNGNSNHYNIARTIESVLNQTYKNIELIVIDGASTDGTIEIIKKYAKKGKISYWVSEKDSGIYDAMNKGIYVAKGEFFYFLNSDDYLVDDKVITNVTDSLRNNTDLDIVYGFVEYYQKDKNNGRIVGDISINNCRLGLHAPHQGTFFKRKVVAECNFFDISYKSAADLDFFCKCSKKSYKIKDLNCVIAVYSIGGMSSNRRIAFSESSKIILKHFGFYWYLRYIIIRNFRYYLKKVVEFIK